MREAQSTLSCDRCGGPALGPDEIIAFPEDDAPGDGGPYCVNRCEE